MANWATSLGQIFACQADYLFENKDVGLYERKLLKEGTASCAGGSA